MQQLNEFKRLYPEYTVIFLHVAGSTLYGTNLPTSDTDYRGIFIPSLKDIVMKTDIDQWTSNTNGTTEKNSTDDVDFTLWSVYKFVKLLQVGDTNAFDTLFAYGSHAEIMKTELMTTIYNNRENFYPETLRSFFGYALGQVKKYSIKGDKLQDILMVKKIVEYRINTFDGTTLPMGTIKDFIDELPITNSLKIVTDGTAEYYQVLDKKFITNIRLSEFLDKLNEMEAKYGSRAKASMDNNSVDWKSMYHAFRVLMECHELMEKGTISFPLDTAGALLEIRQQKLQPMEAFSLLEESYNLVSEFEKGDANYLKHVKRNPDVFKEILWKYFKLEDALEIGFWKRTQQT